ncbi:MAG: hypothetical protein K6L73_08220 [Cellvibrionaceae bacterium]
MNEVVEQSQVSDSSSGTAKVIYILYLIGIILGVTGIVGVIMAYVSKSEAPDWLKTHYQFQIRTFWIGLLFMVIGGFLLMVLIGYLVFLFWTVWLIIRSVKGLQALERKEPVANPTSWMFG